MGQPSRFVLTRKELNLKATDIFSDPMKHFLWLDRMVELELAPISGINVGAVGLGSSDDMIFLGINVELPGLPLHHSIHAVQFLVTNLALNSQRFLRDLVVSSNDSTFDAPCGHCRQFLQELRESPIIKILTKNPEKNENEYVELKSLFPRSETLILPEDFPVPLLLQTRNNGLTLTGDICECDDSCTHLKCRALAAANKSFAPYSKCPSGVALRDCDGKVYRGWYMESVAFNPSLGPLQAALVDFVASGGKGFEKIVEAVLVEKKDAVVSQEKTARMILETIAATNPMCVSNVFHC
ncbi:unnamed protein product [Arabis nemorensis]|uniref:CMP/dCMP-type deaminase domain-containing protein n=1 Tax=Arabis nemorensis TaxID=586526 RepID=A0A565B1Y9_9BRAS|nr:unnamed protein product [Arabis nemorensis]